jgi:hypothetical protein
MMSAPRVSPGSSGTSADGQPPTTGYRSASDRGCVPRFTPVVANHASTGTIRPSALRSMACSRTPGAQNSHMTRLLIGLIVSFALWTGGLSQAGQTSFPRPQSLQPAIAFWTRVFTEVDSDSGFVHDSRNLAFVYETLTFTPTDSNREQQRRIDEAIERYRDALLALAEGKRTNLTRTERRALGPWGDGATPETLRTAADNLRFQRGQADGFRDGLIRSGAWDRQIRTVLRELGLPEALAALPYVESSYHPLVRSSAGAAGLWQFTRSTGQRYLRVDHVVDERLDPLESTRAAARLLQHNYSVLKSWPLAITAYNHGLSGMRRAVRVTGTDDIGTIVRDYDGRLFGFASRNFYASFLAALDVSNEYRRHFGALKRMPADNIVRIELPAYFPAGVLTEGLAVDMATLRSLNPALQPAVWDGRKHLPKGYRLHLPAGIGYKKTRERHPLGNRSALPDHSRRADGHERAAGCTSRPRRSRPAGVECYGSRGRAGGGARVRDTKAGRGRRTVCRAPGRPGCGDRAGAGFGLKAAIRPTRGGSSRGPG